MSVPVSLIAAMGENRVIGADGKIPWRLPSDFAFFKRMTVGKPLIMGRATFEGLGKPLPDRVNIVVSRTPGYQPDGVLVFSDLEAALDHAQALALADHASEVMVGGGGHIYAAAMPYADRLYVTHVALSPEGDTLFPEIDPATWEVVSGVDVPPTDRDSAPFAVKVYERRRDKRR